jgi:hypothetical protein
MGPQLVETTVDFSGVLYYEMASVNNTFSVLGQTSIDEWIHLTIAISVSDHTLVALLKKNKSHVAWHTESATRHGATKNMLTVIYVSYVH